MKFSVVTANISDKKKAESDLQTGYSDSTHTDLYLLKYTASLARDTAERSEVRGGLVVLAVLVLVMYTLYRYISFYTSNIRQKKPCF